MAHRHTRVRSRASTDLPTRRNPVPGPVPVPVPLARFYSGVFPPLRRLAGSNPLDCPWAGRVVMRQLEEEIREVFTTTGVQTTRPLDAHVLGYEVHTLPETTFYVRMDSTTPITFCPGLHVGLHDLSKTHIQSNAFTLENTLARTARRPTTMNSAVARRRPNSNRRQAASFAGAWAQNTRIKHCAHACRELSSTALSTATTSRSEHHPRSPTWYIVSRSRKSVTLFWLLVLLSTPDSGERVYLQMS